MQSLLAARERGILTFPAAMKSNAGAARIIRLMADIAGAFRNIPAIGKECVAHGHGDAASVERIARILGGRHWMDLSVEEVRTCGPDELRMYLTAIGLKHYLPAIMNSALHFYLAEGESRLTECARLMLLPAGMEYESVWLNFGDGLYARGVADTQWEHLLKRSGFLRDEYDPVQRLTVARFIGAMENIEAPSKSLVGQWMHFWSP